MPYVPPATDPARLNTFSDGVFAIAATLLILTIDVLHLPAAGPHPRLAQALARQWPEYLAYVVSFLIILIKWMTHHRMMEHVRRVNNWFLLLNGLVLLVVAFIPFPTALLAAYWNDAREAQTAASVYCGTYLVFALCFTALWRYATHHGRLLGPRPNLVAVARITRRYAWGLGCYVAVFVGSFYFPIYSCGSILLLALYLAWPHPTHVPGLFRRKKPVPGPIPALRNGGG